VRPGQEIMRNYRTYFMKGGAFITSAQDEGIAQAKIMFFLCIYGGSGSIMRVRTCPPVKFYDGDS
jgi:hypothetical protein